MVVFHILCNAAVLICEIKFDFNAFVLMDVNCIDKLHQKPTGQAVNIAVFQESGQIGIAGINALGNGLTFALNMSNGFLELLGLFLKPSFHTAILVTGNIAVFPVHIEAIQDTCRLFEFFGSLL